MWLFETTCPHCQNEKDFKMFGVSEYTCSLNPARLDQLEQINEPTFALPKTQPLARFFAAGTCAGCGAPLVAELEIDAAYLVALRGHIQNEEHRYAGPPPVVRRLFPEPVPLYSHPDIPEKARSLFVDLQNIKRLKPANPAIIVSGCRSVLEEAVKALGGQGDTLNRRLEDLKNRAIINGVLFEWAMNIKDWGNLAVHEIESAWPEAEERLEFTKLFLQYAFEFPARIRQSRAALQARREAPPLDMALDIRPPRGSRLRPKTRRRPPAPAPAPKWG